MNVARAALRTLAMLPLCASLACATSAPGSGAPLIDTSYSTQGMAPQAQVRLIDDLVRQSLAAQSNARFAQAYTLALEALVRWRRLRRTQSTPPTLGGLSYEGLRNACALSATQAKLASDPVVWARHELGPTAFVGSARLMAQAGELAQGHVQWQRGMAQDVGPLDRHELLYDALVLEEATRLLRLTETLRAALCLSASPLCALSALRPVRAKMASWTQPRFVRLPRTEPSAIAVALARHIDLGAWVGVARTIEDHVQRRDALLTIAAFVAALVPDASSRIRAARLLVLAGDSLGGLATRLLDEAALLLASTPACDEALETARRDYARQDVVLAVMQCYADQGRPERAFAVLELVYGRRRYAKALWTLVTLLRRSGRRPSDAMLDTMRKSAMLLERP